MKKTQVVWILLLLLSLVTIPGTAEKKGKGKDKSSPMADAAMWQGSVNDTLTELSATIEGIDPDDSRTLARAGILLLRAGDQQGAADLFERTERSDPKDDEAFAMIGEAYGEAKLWGDADTWFQKATGLDPEDADHQALWGVTYWNRGEKEKAIELFVSALTESPRSERVHYKIGLGIR